MLVALIDLDEDGWNRGESTALTEVPHRLVTCRGLVSGGSRAFMGCVSFNCHSKYGRFRWLHALSQNLERPVEAADGSFAVLVEQDPLFRHSADSLGKTSTTFFRFLDSLFRRSNKLLLSSICQNSPSLFMTVGTSVSASSWQDFVIGAEVDR